MDAIVDAFGTFVEGVANVVTFILKAVGISALVIGWAVATAFVARDYWNWFVAPLGMPHIGLAHAFGLTYFIFFLRTDYSKSASRDDGDDDSPIYKAIGGLFAIGFTWGVGWLLVTFGGPF